MNIELLTVGKTDVKWVKEGLDVYVARLQHYVPFKVTEIPELKKAQALSQDQIKEREGELLLKHLQHQDTLILLDEHGIEYRSTEFAEMLEKYMLQGTKTLVFAVGGAYGFSPAVHAMARAKMSLSKMTFTHQMVRTVFAEQLYRAFTILRGEPYHNE
jgi:23S rRNA (pseudouridine1915-N3)-methyltransferase